MEYSQMIKDTIIGNDVVLFMKGTKDEPRCGFSARAVNILKYLNVPFKDVNLLEDHPNIVFTLRDLYGWPTSPQLYIRGQLIGGSDIMMEMYESGELQGLLGISTDRFKAEAG